VSAPLQYGTQPPPDPTAVMGRRTLAWIADLVLFLAVVAAGFASMGEYVEVPAGVEDPCQALRDQAEARGDDIGSCLDFRDMGIEEAEDRVYLLDASESGAQTLVSVAWFAFFVVLQGLTGGSPGKLLFGLRVVDQYGNRCGLARSLGRTAMWIVDAAPWFVPLVGPITAFTSTGHRRVGDLAAGTYVVTAGAAGAPVMPSVAAPPAGATPWGAPPPAWGDGPPSAPPTSTAPPAAAPWPLASDAPTTVAGTAEPAPTDAAPPADPAPFVAPGGDPAAPASAPATPSGPPAARRYELPPPQWDPARGTYLQWEPNQQAWLQWDAPGQRWKPIDT